MPSEPDGSVAGIVLAAGASQRLGRNKLFLELEGQTLMRRVVGRAVAAGLAPVLVVLGHEADRALREIDGMACQPVMNPDYALGINVSLRAGIAAVPARVAAGVVLLGDMPFVTTEMIGAVVERFRQSGAPLVVSDYAGIQAPPTLFDRSLLDEFLAMEGDACSRQLVKRHRSEAVVVGWPATALADIDVPDDYERAKAAFAHRSPVDAR
jgi:molybdenum cofactor cytidylyltransferase